MRAGEDVALSVVTVLELAHGAARANTPERKATREQFIRELMAAVPVHRVSAAVALFGPGRLTARARPRASICRSQIC
jgi:predicted nucleic acid-binding protein